MLKQSAATVPEEGNRIVGSDEVYIRPALLLGRRSSTMQQGEGAPGVAKLGNYLAGNTPLSASVEPDYCRQLTGGSVGEQRVEACVAERSSNRARRETIST